MGSAQPMTGLLELRDREVVGFLARASWVSERPVSLALSTMWMPPAMRAQRGGPAHSSSTACNPVSFQRFRTIGQTLLLVLAQMKKEKKKKGNSLRESCPWSSFQSGGNTFLQMCFSRWGDPPWRHWWWRRGAFPEPRTQSWCC